MLIPPPVATIYGELRPVALALKAEVDRFMDQRPQQWHYVSRVKSEESFFQKLETGRVEDPRDLEDFFACTIIVPTGRSITEARAFLDSFFSIMYQRPEDGPTKKSASDFRFDDLRLFGRLREPGSVPSGPIHSMTFEIQIKTLLAHAWGVATHDVVYKSTTTSWARDRIAFQLRAMLEHVELAVNGVNALEIAGVDLPKGDDDDRINSYVAFIDSKWPADFRPPDLRRAATSVDQLASKFKVDKDDLLLRFVSHFDEDALPLGTSPVQYAFRVIEESWPEKAKGAWQSQRLTGYSWMDRGPESSHEG